MTIQHLTLVAPNSLPVVGIKLADSSVVSFKYSYDDKNKISMYILPNGETAQTSSQRGTILVDSSGKEWDAIDVEFHSLLNS